MHLYSPATQTQGQESAINQTIGLCDHKEGSLFQRQLNVLKACCSDYIFD